MMSDRLSRSLMQIIQYHRASIFFHWLLVVLLAIAFISIELKGQFIKGSEPRELCKTIHGFVGQLIFIAMVMRLIIRLIYGVPTPLARSKAAAIVAQSMHWIFYILLLGLPILGVLFLQAGGKEIASFNWALPQMIESGASARKPLKALHEWLGNALYFLIGLHALAALSQHYILQNQCLLRMLGKNKA
ncbi:cytochrome b561 [Polynucleobacter sphagniphilus]|uniref:cytochrome b n=1 Tax=Polynucleobacter sphagniphilus TaxID=1743169 RepID=UPI002473BF75|nr:cytochrome b/b6 domain-containing protein [Polynucleobacter sphagniphilus]MDH6420601.1 cytochrome b561 [Polynucleobacter sphagniphilus]